MSPYQNKSQNFGLENVVLSEKTPPCGKITSFSEFYASNYPIKHMFA